MAPGSRCRPVPSMTISEPDGTSPPPGATVVIEPETTRRSPSTMRSGSTIVAFWMSRPLVIRGCAQASTQRAFRGRGALEIGVVATKCQRVGVARLSRRAHNPETDRSNRSPATIESIIHIAFRESDECEMKVDKEATESLMKLENSRYTKHPSFVGSYTTARQHGLQHKVRI